MNPVKTICIEWTYKDVLEVRPDLNENQAQIVLAHVEKNHDCNYGITWDTLLHQANDLYGECDE